MEGKDIRRVLREQNLEARRNVGERFMASREHVTAKDKNRDHKYNRRKWRQSKGDDMSSFFLRCRIGVAVGLSAA